MRQRACKNQQMKERNTMKKISTRMMSLALCLAMLLSMSVTAFAYGESTAEVADPYTIEGKYV